MLQPLSPLRNCRLSLPCPPPPPFAADDEALAAFQLVSRLEGIIPALETSHALAYLDKLCPTVPDGTRIVLNCSGRGDKDVTVRGGAPGAAPLPCPALCQAWRHSTPHRRRAPSDAAAGAPLPPAPHPWLQNAANYLPHLAGGPKP